MRQILFSCAGTTDPVRGEHDGPMLHILRHYRPERVVLFLTPEIAALAEADSRFIRTEAWIAEHWGGYRPGFKTVFCDVRDAHDIDALEQPMYEAVTQISREEPDAEILINLTSGTPQMQMILSQLAMDMRFHARGVQVSNYEKKSGSSQRANERDYDVELELECNEDELPGAENRCSEPKMLAVRREYLRRQITTLLEQRDFAAVEALENELPENVKQLVKHLASRNRLQRGEAQRLAGEMKALPFKLYAFKSGDRAKYTEVSEYYLMTKNLVRAGNCTEFLLHLEPLVLTLQLSLLDQLLRGLGNSTADFIVQEWSGRQTFDPELLRKKLPALYTHYCQKISDCKRCDVSIYLCGLLLAYFPNVPPEAAKLFAHYDLLKESRNLLAHALCTVTEADIKNACGVEPECLLEELEKTIIAVYPVCDPSIFHIYDKSIDYIKANL